MSISLPVLIVLSVVVIGLTLLSVATLLAWRDALQRLGRPVVDPVATVPPEVGALLARVERRLADAQDCSAEMARMHQTLLQMRADVEWLAGERMIEQAIEMCRAGLSNESISADLGLHPADVRTLRLLRAH